MTGTGLRVASDVGGTFTDSLAYDEATRRLTVSKVATTPANQALGTVAGLKRALGLQGRDGREVTYVGHGMTTATNAVIQRRGAHIAFVTTEGFRDLLEIGRQNRPRLYDFRVMRAPPLAARADCYTVAGRLAAGGAEIRPLDEAGLAEIAGRIQASGAAAVAICFLHAYANPAHERRAKEILEAALSGVFVCASTDVVREFREYERASTTALNAYLVPVMDRYLGSLEAMLADQGDGLGLPPGRPVMVMEASGGLMTVATARAKPVHTVLSGPAGGVVASAHVAGLSGIGDIITMDMGGTSTDISLILAGRPQITSQASLEGLPVRIPVLDINAIGAGGGSIAWIDEGGALRVGPQSAEAVPGPACYRRGGTLPTVSDANLVLGRLGAKTALGGELTLDPEAARRAVEEHIAGPLAMDPIEAAAGIIRVANANMERGIRVVSVERGHDPRDFVLVPFGGAGPMHGAAVARSLRIPRVLVPPTPGILCAMGMLLSDLRHDLVTTHIAPLEAFGRTEIAAALGPLAAQGRALLAADGVPEERRRIEMVLDLRYVGQSYELMVPLAGLGEAACAGLASAFHATHRQKFGHADEQAPVEVVNVRVIAIGERPPFELPELESGGAAPEVTADLGRRSVYFEVDGAWHDCRVWRREALLAGNRIDGPAIIEEISATTVLCPGDHALVEPHGSLIIDVASPGAEP